MPVILSPEHGGWVRVNPPKRRSASPQKQADALKSGALSYFACTPVPTNPGSKLPPCPKYDIDAPPSPKKKKARVVSAPVTIDDDDEDDYAEPEPDYVSVRPRESRRTVSAAPRVVAPPSATRRTEPAQGQNKYWTGPSNRSKTPPAPRNNYARSTVSSSWASATQPLNL